MCTYTASLGLLSNPSSYLLSSVFAKWCCGKRHSGLHMVGHIVIIISGSETPTVKTSGLLDAGVGIMRLESI